MAQTTALHEERARRWLDLLGYRRLRPLRVELLRDGRSGAFTYRIRSGEEALVLKIVSAESPDGVLERGRREAMFYSQLAGAVPVLVPEVVASYLHTDLHMDGEASDGLALLLREYRSPEPVASWEESRFDGVARELAKLHAAYWGRTEEFGRYEWLRRPSADFSPYREPALAAWRALWEQERLAMIFDSGAIGRIERAVAALTGGPQDSSFGAPRAVTTGPAGSGPAASDPAALSSVLSTPPDLPLTLCHGDAHHENLLVREDGAWVWSDWQEVGIGYGADDVSFFFQRAVAAGGKADMSRMLRVYHEELERQTGAAIDLAALRRRVVLYELTTRVLHWPAYLAEASERVVRMHVSRVTELLYELDLAF